MDNHNTPRTRLRSEIREKRLAFYDNQSSAKSTNSDRAVSPKSKERHLKPRNGTSRELELNVKELADEECDAETSIDTSRTSDILMETARDYREILRERQERQTKRTGATPATKMKTSDLSDRSVTEVLKVLNQRANQRRREMLRFQDITDSEEEEEEEEEAKRQLPSFEVTAEKKSNDVLGGDTGQTDSPAKNPADCSVLPGSEVGRGFLSLLEELHQCEQLNRSASDFRSAHTEVLGDSVETFFSNALNAKRQPKIAFSAQEIYSQAETIQGRSDVDQRLPRRTTEPPHPTDLPSAVPERSRSPVQRNVRFDCPPTPAGPVDGANSRTFPDASQSLDARSSASGVSCLSIGDVAQRLQQLGINPKLIGLDVPASASDAANGATRRPRGKAGRRLVKVCPVCGKCNAESVSWCLGCAAVLIGLEPQPLPRRRPKVAVEESVDSSTSLTGCDTLTSFVAEEEEVEEEVEDGESFVNSSRYATATITSVNGESTEETAIVEKLFDHWDGNESEDDDDEVSKESPTLMETPNSVYDEEVTPLTSPMVPLSPPTPAAVWDPKKVDVAALIEQSRALVSKPLGPTRESDVNENSPEPEASVVPRPVNSRKNSRAELVQQSMESFSSLSLATPSIVGRYQPSDSISKDLHLDLSSSVEEAEDKGAGEDEVEEIAVLDRAEVLALRQSSAASGKPDLVPQLPLAWSPASSERTIREEPSSSSDWRPTNWRDSASRDSNSRDPHAVQQRPKAHRGRHWGGGRHRPNSASAAIYMQTQNSASTGQTPPRRRPNSSEHHGGYQRRWQNSSIAWSNQHPSVLKKKPAAVVVRESWNAAKMREGKPPAVSHLSEDGCLHRPQSRSHPNSAGDKQRSRSSQQPKKSDSASNNSPQYHQQFSSNNSPQYHHQSAYNNSRQQSVSSNSPRFHQQPPSNNSPQFYQQPASNNNRQQSVSSNSPRFHQQSLSNNSPQFYQQPASNNSRQQSVSSNSPRFHQQPPSNNSPQFYQQPASNNSRQQSVSSNSPRYHQEPGFNNGPQFHQAPVSNNGHQFYQQLPSNNNPYFHQPLVYNNSRPQSVVNNSPQFHQSPVSFNSPQFQQSAPNHVLQFHQQSVATCTSPRFQQTSAANNSHHLESKLCSPAFNISLTDAASSPIGFTSFPSDAESSRSENPAGETSELKVKQIGNAVNPMGLMPDAIKYLEQRGWNAAEQSPWLYLADEVWLRILRFLSIEDLTAVAATCQRLHCVANDNSLWRHIVVKRRHEMSREDLLKIADRCPASLKLRQCRAPNMTVQDLCTFFDLCGHSLKKLAFNGCNQGAFSDDQFIVFAALYCPKLTTVDFSYAYGIRDSTVRALAESCASLQSVKLNGAQKITDMAIQCLIDFHAESLHTLELYCCFGISSNSVRELGKKCVNLSHVCFGTCTRVSSNALINFAGHRREKLRHLDVRGLPTVLDSTIASIVAVCPRLESVALSNCCGISNISIRALANSCAALRKLDVCGCNQVGSDGAQDLVRKCKFLEELDFSSTCVDHRTITCLARTYVPKLKTLRLNFCCNLKEDGLSRLCDSTKSLKTLLLFGVRNVSPIFIQRLRLEHPRISIKSDDSVENNEH